MIVWYCPLCPYSFGSRSGIAVRDARLAHQQQCKPHNGALAQENKDVNKNAGYY